MPLREEPNDTKVYYIPGFGSSAQSQKAQDIGAWCAAKGIDFAVLEYPDTYDADDVFAHHGNLISTTDHGRRIFIGCSLGGFWAAVLATAWWGKSVLINPAVDPATSLRKYLTPDGAVRGFHDDGIKSLTVDMPVGYNAYYERMRMNRYGRIVVLCADDEVLDYRLAQATFEHDSQMIVLPTGGHSGSAHAALVTQCIEQLVDFDIERSEETIPPSAVDTVSHILWRVDPMNTCCYVNAGMEDEYDAEAKRIVAKVREGTALREAVVSVFDLAFWTDCLDTPEKRAALDRVLVMLAPVFNADDAMNTL